MRIQHNLMAANAARQLGITEGQRMRSATKLSGGYKINIAADDAAGLSISEKMRKQIRGLNRGIENAQDGVSLCQVADGALNEVHAILQRINELAVRSANGTNSASDRRDIDNEVSALLTEIDRIGDTTKFNDKYLFRGGRGRKTEEVFIATLANPTAQSKFFQLLGNDTSRTGYMEEEIDIADINSMKNTGTGNQGPLPYVGVHIDFGKLIDQDKNIGELAGTEFYVNCCTDCCPARVEFVDDVGVSVDYSNMDTALGIKIGIRKADGSCYDSAADFVNAIVDSMIAEHISDSSHVMYACDNTTLYLYDIDNNNWTPGEKRLAYFCDYPTDGQETHLSGLNNQGTGLWIQSGCDAGDGIMLYMGYMNTDVLMLDDLNVLSEENSTKAIRQIDRAIQMVSAQRSRIGACQNRLEHTIANEKNIVENTTASESRIRDSDMAEEMVKYAMTGILLQTGQAMLAQARQFGQDVMTLLAG